MDYESIENHYGDGLHTIRKRWCLMKEIMVVTRITIGGQQYTAEELGEEKAKEIGFDACGIAQVAAADSEALFLTDG